MKDSSAVASLEKKHGSWLIHGILCTDTVVSLTERGRQVITEIKQRDNLQGTKSTICFDFAADTGIQDASAVAMLLEWIRFTRHHELRITFTHLPHKLKIMAELGGVGAMLQQHVIK